MHLKNFFLFVSTFNPARQRCFAISQRCRLFFKLLKCATWKHAARSNKKPLQMCVCASLWQKQPKPRCCAFHRDSRLNSSYVKRKKKKKTTVFSVHASTLHTTRVRSEGSHQICRYKFKVGGRRCSGGSQVPRRQRASRKCRR